MFDTHEATLLRPYRLLEGSNDNHTSRTIRIAHGGWLCHCCDLIHWRVTKKIPTGLSTIMLSCCFVAEHNVTPQIIPCREKVQHNNIQSQKSIGQTGRKLRAGFRSKRSGQKIQMENGSFPTVRHGLLLRTGNRLFVTICKIALIYTLYVLIHTIPQIFRKPIYIYSCVRISHHPRDDLMKGHRVAATLCVGKLRCATGAVLSDSESTVEALQ